MPKHRILALHSFRTSAAIFKEQVSRAKLDKLLNEHAELVYVNAPFPASGPVPADVTPYFSGPYYEWFTADMIEDRLVYDVSKVKATEKFIVEFIKTHGPFDGIMGFSQGGMLCSALVAMQHQGMLLQDVPRIKFCIVIGAPKSRYEKHLHAFQDKVGLPSAHIIGEKDSLVKYCRELTQVFANPVVLVHQRGHVVPELEPHQAAALVAFIKAAATMDPNAKPPPRRSKL